MEAINIWTIIIPAISAILVAGIPAIISYYGVKAQLRANEKKDERERQTHKDEIINVIEKHSQQQDEILLCIIRTEILRLYFKHKQRNKLELAQYEAENERKLFEQYTALGGNSFVKDVHEEMKKWPIIGNHQE